MCIYIEGHLHIIKDIYTPHSLFLSCGKQTISCKQKNTPSFSITPVPVIANIFLIFGNMQVAFLLMCIYIEGLLHID